MIVLKTMMRQRLRRSAKKICSAFCRTTSDDDTSIVPNHSCATMNRPYCSYKRAKLLWQSKSPGDLNFLPGYLQHHRFYSTNPPQEFPRLTELPMRVDTRFVSGFKVTLMDLFVVRPQLDPDFSLKVFLKTTHKVVQMVSNRLASSDYDVLQEMMTPHVFDQIKENLPHFTDQQRENLMIDIEDIVVSYVDDMRIDDIGGDGAERNLQITAVYHVLRGAGELRKVFENLNPVAIMQGQDPMEEWKQKKERLYGFVTNFSYSRTYNVETKTAGDWIINGLNFYARKIDF